MIAGWIPISSFHPIISPHVYCMNENTVHLDTTSASLCMWLTFCSGCCDWAIKWSPKKNNTIHSQVINSWSSGCLNIQWKLIGNFFKVLFIWKLSCLKTSFSTLFYLGVKLQIKLKYSFTKKSVSPLSLSWLAYLSPKRRMFSRGCDFLFWQWTDNVDVWKQTIAIIIWIISATEHQMLKM